MGGMGNCHKCGKEFLNVQLRKCSRCRLDKYCVSSLNFMHNSFIKILVSVNFEKSVKCQKDAWKADHKNYCKPCPDANSPRAIVNNFRSKVEEDKLWIPWIRAWRSILVEFSTRCLDLANNPPGRHSTHHMVLFLRRRYSGEYPTRSFEMVEGKVMSNADIEPHCCPRRIEATTVDRVCFIMVLENNEHALTDAYQRVRSVNFEATVVPFLQSIDKVVSAARAKDWDKWLKFFIKMGQVSWAKQQLGIPSDWE
ncbi:hypothetical protein K439DRAFT_857784 [Ramaria rubella]|nr:hypothetical protein K439DRAFT_857784 [Ramaria rubella]